MTSQAMARHLPGMTSVPASLLRALGQLSDPAVLRVLVKSVAVTLLLFVAAGAAGWYALDRLLDAYRVPYASEAGPLIAFVLSVLGAWLLFRFVALAVLQFFADEIVKAVERRHYPAEAARARELPFREELANACAGWHAPCWSTSLPCPSPSRCWSPDSARQSCSGRSMPGCWGANCRTWSGCATPMPQVPSRR